MKTIVHPATGDPTQIVMSIEDPDLDPSKPYLVVTGKPPCPICETAVEGYESNPGLAYVSEHGGPYGGRGTFLVAGGDKPPAEMQFDQIVPLRWLSNIGLNPCGHRLWTETFKMYSVDEGLFHIEGEEFIDPL